MQRGNGKLAIPDGGKVIAPTVALRFNHHHRPVVMGQMVGVFDDGKGPVVHTAGGIDPLTYMVGQVAAGVGFDVDGEQVVTRACEIMEALGRKKAEIAEKQKQGASS